MTQNYWTIYCLTFTLVIIFNSVEIFGPHWPFNLPPLRWFQAAALREAGNTIENEAFFDTLKIRPQLEKSEIRRRAHEAKINIRYFPDGAVSWIRLELVLFISKDGSSSDSFSLFWCFILYNWLIKFCWYSDSNCGSLIQKLQLYQTEPQLLPQLVLVV